MFSGLLALKSRTARMPWENQSHRPMDRGPTHPRRVEESLGTRSGIRYLSAIPIAHFAEKTRQRDHSRAVALPLDEVERLHLSLSVTPTVIGTARRRHPWLLSSMQVAPKRFTDALVFRDAWAVSPGSRQVDGGQGRYNPCPSQGHWGAPGSFWGALFFWRRTSIAIPTKREAPLPTRPPL